MIEFFKSTGVIFGAILSIIAALGYLIAIIVYVTNLKWRTINLESSHKEMKEQMSKLDAITSKQIDLFHEVQMNGRELKIIAEGQERRLRLLEDRIVSK